jgi:hypothetical protein
MLITVDADFTNLHISYLESVKCRVDPIAPFFEVIAPRLLEPLTEPDLKISLMFHFRVRFVWFCHNAIIDALRLFDARIFKIVNDVLSLTR